MLRTDWLLTAPSSLRWSRFCLRVLKHPRSAYFVPGTVLSTLQVLTYSVLPQPQEEGGNIVPILQTRTLRHREVK